MDAAEFDQFYAATSSRLVGVLYAMTGDRAEAQDVVQEAFVRAWDHRAQLSRAEYPEAWVRTVARRIAVSRWRRTRTSAIAWRRHGPPDPVPEPDVVDPALTAALRRLPQAQRHAIVLFYLCDASIQQIADELGVPVGTVKARLSRGRTALAQMLTPATSSPEAHHD